jgi:hypothetical protein
MKEKWYYLELIGIFLAAGGAALIVEHQLQWGIVDFADFVGHEVYGLVCLVVGAVLAIIGYKKRD